MKNVSRSTNLMVKISFITAFALVLTYFEFPILPAFPFLQIDLSDIPALIGAFAYGPLYGIIIEALKNVLIFFVKSSKTGGIGELANFIIGASFVGTAGLIYSRNKTRKNALISLVAAVIVMVIVGVLANYYILIPLYASFLPELKEAAYVKNYITSAVIPFNLIKSVLVSGVTLAIYKKISVLILKESLQIKNVNNPKKTA